MQKSYMVLAYSVYYSAGNNLIIFYIFYIFIKKRRGFSKYKSGQHFPVNTINISANVGILNFIDF